MHLLRFSCLETMERARTIANRGQRFFGTGSPGTPQDSLSSARELLQSKISELETFAGEEHRLLTQAGRNQEREQRAKLADGLLADLRSCLNDMRDMSQYEQVGSKKMAWMSNAYGKQRALGGMESAQNHLFGSSMQCAQAVACQTAQTISGNGGSKQNAGNKTGGGGQFASAPPLGRQQQMPQPHVLQKQGSPQTMQRQSPQMMQGQSPQMSPQMMQQYGFQMMQQQMQQQNYAMQQSQRMPPQAPQKRMQQQTSNMTSSQVMR